MPTRKRTKIFFQFTPLKQKLWTDCVQSDSLKIYSLWTIQGLDITVCAACAVHNWEYLKNKHRNEQQKGLAFSITELSTILSTLIEVK